MKDRRPDSLILHIAQPDETPLLVYQGVPFVHRVESLTSIDGRSRWDDIYDKHRTCSYRICRHTRNPPYLKIFLANRLIYQEASITFYGKNRFHFPSKGCENTLNACWAFLEDRPQRVRTYIHNISLSIGYAYRYLPVLQDNGLYWMCGAHRLTMERLNRSLRHLGTLDQLSFVIQEQHPSEKALKSLLQKHSYASIWDWPLQKIPVLQCLEIEFQHELHNKYDPQSSQTYTRYLAHLIRLGANYFVYDPAVVSSEILVEGKKMTSSIFTYLVRKPIRG